MSRVYITFVFILTVLSCNAQKINMFSPGDSIWFDQRTNESFRLSFMGYRGCKNVIIDNVFMNFDIDASRRSVNEYLFSRMTKASIVMDNKTGYRYFSNSSSAWGGNAFRSYVLAGGDIFLVAHSFIDNNGKIGFSGCVTNKTIGISMEEGLRMRLGGEKHTFRKYTYLDSGIKEISSSSYLEESRYGKKIDYKPEYIINRICKAGEDFEYNIEFDNFKRCWSEGVIGDGVGERIYVEYTRKSDKILIANGYIDFGNLKAYKNNNRLKKIKITSIDPLFETNYIFEDYVAYHTIDLPQETKSITITIMDVYKGEKFDDTCITAICLPQNRWRGSDEENEEVISYLDDLGVIGNVKEFLQK